ncbi:MAG: NAD-dependent epimerase/dehydratase family protein, partial [Hyphomicrobium sp.]
MTLACVTGSTGFIGRHLCEQLAAQAIALRTAHSGSQASALLTDVVKRSESELASALEGADVVYHLAGIAHDGVRGDLLEVNRDLTLRLYRAALLSGVKIFVWLSTLKVLGDVAEAPVGLDAPYRPRGTYAQSKAQTEQTLLALPTQATELVIVRPPLVYGPNVKGNFRRLLQLCKTPLPLPFEAAQGKRSMVGVRNLVSLLVHLGEKGGDPESRIVHVRDTQEWSVNSLVEELRR